jgi:hypothetical protein
MKSAAPQKETIMGYELTSLLLFMILKKRKYDMCHTQSKLTFFLFSSTHTGQIHFTNIMK